MRKLHALVGILLITAANAQGERRIDLNRPWGTHDQRFRFDIGFGFGGVQYSYITGLDWSQLPTGPGTKPERRGILPALYLEGEYKTSEQLGLVGHVSTWTNYRLQETSSADHYANGHAKTLMAGVRKYWSSPERRTLWYSGAMGGACHATITGDTGDAPRVRVDFAHQLTFIGFRPGRGVGSSIEIGQGYKGVVSLSLCAAF